jgi:ubiquinone/menaquinone biosynthesis C-methylase UbiE
MEYVGGLMPSRYDPVIFDRRYRPEALDRWVPLLLEVGKVTPQDRVIDVGCGTGGITEALGRRSRSPAVGVDTAADLLAFAVERRPSRLARFMFGDACHLPLADETFDCVIASLVVHQVANRHLALTEFNRVLGRRGNLVVRTVEPEDAAERVPYRYFPSMKALQYARMPTSTVFSAELESADFHVLAVRRVKHRTRVDVEDAASLFRDEAARKYPWLTHDEIAVGIQQMRLDADSGGELWDERSTTLIGASRPI